MVDLRHLVNLKSEVHHQGPPPLTLLFSSTYEILVNLVNLWSTPQGILKKSTWPSLLNAEPPGIPKKVNLVNQVAVTCFIVST